ncbi:MAG: YggT family protein [Geobacteraceae bacterium]|nr:YggT family protein [Geobacteraceae bacterium]
MLLFENTFDALATLVSWIRSLLGLYSYIIIARAVVSWVDPNPYNPLVQFIAKITDPLLNRIRKAVPPIGGIDLSPMIAIAFIYLVLDKIILKTLYIYLFKLSQPAMFRGLIP